MTSKKPLRCAIYTRKSTEHGLELEFNSLDAQREACEAYIKSQTHEGWQALGQRYDDAAFSGGNLDRPALQKLLNDIDNGTVNVVVVYKIDRLTRSLADFAKLVERFEKHSVSFVAVTQQFNTTTSMGRLTLNVLLSFAQFERELASERVRDKVAASRQKGKWTGGGVPLGYDVQDKNLVVNRGEAETVHLIFKRYLELKCLRLLKGDLDKRGIGSKRRTNASGKLFGGVPMTYGPLAYLLKNRTYLGEIGYKGKWFTGEHQAIIPLALFDAVQELLKSNSVARRQQRSSQNALLTGILFDARGDRMTPSFTNKRGVRYRFYVRSAVLTARGNPASLRRIAAPELERTVISALRERFPQGGDIIDKDLIASQVDRIVLSETTVSIYRKTGDSGGIQIMLPSIRTPPARIETGHGALSKDPDLNLIQALARAHAWRQALVTGAYQTVEKLADAVAWNPKVVRKGLRLAYLAPDIIESILRGSQLPALDLTTLQGVASLSWDEQRRLLSQCRG
jgi:DNA invertase Pin-like site-specific DNA recombinase